MSKTALTGFYTKNVKVYGTTKGSEPYTMTGRILRKAYPFLIASVMTLSGCGVKQPDEKTSDSEKAKAYTEYYQEVVDKYRLLSLKDKEPLPQEKIKALLQNPNAPMLKDVNYNHCPENQQNFWEIIKNGINAVKQTSESKKLNDNQKAEYHITAYKMLAQITRVKGTDEDIDLSDYNNMKAFLFFEKVLEHKDDYNEVLAKEPGIIDERTEIFGRYYKDYQRFEQLADNYPGIAKFAKALYKSDKQFIIGQSDSVAANAVSRGYLDGWMKEQNIKDKDLWYYGHSEEDAYINAVAYYRRRGTTLNISLGVDATGDLEHGAYSPVGSLIIHELQHTMQYRPGSLEKPSDNRVERPLIVEHPDRNFLQELGPTLYSLALEDKIYKEIHNISLDKTMDYGTVTIGKNKIKLGETAIFFQKMLEKYPHKSIDAVLCEKEVLHKINQWGGEKPAMVMQQARGSGR